MHTPGAGAAVPIGLTRIRESPLFSLVPATETHIDDALQLFDDIDAWLEAEIPEAKEWIGSGLNVRFDENFRSLLDQSRSENNFKGLLHYFEARQEMIDNMDY
ncbi:hypothetical protein CGQ24_09290 [Arthrobacter sp. 7749]|nr:hypothetical protein CGQ24_09290 [Arthrobacter sp. 7749]